MARIRLRHVNAITGRDGKVRYYYRRRGHSNVRLPGIPGTEEFMQAYAGARASEPASNQIGATRNRAGSVAAAVAGYLSSAEFAGLAATTQRARRQILEAFRAEHGEKSIASLQRVHVERMVNLKAATPGAALNFLIAIRTLMRFAVSVGLRTDDPTIGVRRPRTRSTGIYAWNENDIAAFGAAHPVGSRERLALALLLYTGQRRGDVIRMGRQHMRAGVVHIKQDKTGAELAIPVHPQLRAIIDATPCDQMTFIVTRFGGPFNATAFSNWFKAACRKAGLPKQASVHGLRKAAARRLAEAGCTAHEISAITGHASLKEVQRYTASADQSRMARAAIRKLVEGGT
jgi:integrase